MSKILPTFLRVWINRASEDHMKFAVSFVKFSASTFKSRYWIHTALSKPEIKNISIACWFLMKDSLPGHSSNTAPDLHKLPLVFQTFTRIKYRLQVGTKLQSILWHYNSIPKTFQKSWYQTTAVQSVLGFRMSFIWQGESLGI